MNELSKPTGKLDIPESWGLSLPLGDYRTTIDESTPEGKDLILQFCNGEGIKPELQVNRLLLCTDISIMPIAKIVDGEQLMLPRIAVHHADGTYTDFRSPGIMKSLGFIIKRFGMPPWNPAIMLLLERFKTGQGQDGNPRYMYRYTVAK